MKSLILLAAFLFCAFTALGAAPPEGMNQSDFRAIVTSAKEKVFPSLVFIRCVAENFEMGERKTDSSAGSGVLISSKGEVLTNWHVIDKAVEVRCLLLDGRAYDAEILGSDKDTDLALLKLKNVPEDEKLPEAKIGDSSKLTEGDFVMAMGAPWGLSRSVSIGIISCTRRFLDGDSEYSLWLQTDASISPGNSGGPLVNTDGEVIGINARGTTSGGGLGFAIPSETIQLVLPRLRQNGKVDWCWTGLLLQPIRDFEKNMYFEGKDGVLIADVEDDSPAKKAGLAPRDRILKINGETLAGLTAEDLPKIRRHIGFLSKESPAKLEILRDGKSLIVEMTPREKGKVEGEDLALERWDFSVRTINQFGNPELYFQKQKGVYVRGLKRPGNATSSGLNENDIIVKVNGKSVETLDEIKKAHQDTLARVEDEHRLILSVMRQGLLKQVVIDISRDFSRK